jgi:hypothetical protein
MSAIDPARLIDHMRYTSILSAVGFSWLRKMATQLPVLVLEYEDLLQVLVVRHSAHTASHLLRHIHAIGTTSNARSFLHSPRHIYHVTFTTSYLHVTFITS